MRRGHCAREAQGHPRGRAGDLRRGMQAGIANLFQRGELVALAEIGSSRE